MFPNTCINVFNPIYRSIFLFLFFEKIESVS